MDLHFVAEYEEENGKEAKATRLSNQTDQRDLHQESAIKPFPKNALLTVSPVLAMLPPADAMPPPAAWKRKVITSLQTKSRTMIRDLIKRHRSSPRCVASLGRMM